MMFMSAKIAICVRELLRLISISFKSEKENVCSCEFSDRIWCWGGDSMWIAAVLGYTGPKEVHFCKDCACCLFFEWV